MKKVRYFAADFETTVYDGQTHTEAWAAAIVELYSDDVSIYHSIGDLYEYLISLKTNVICYFHNLKFDGNFWLNYCMGSLGMKNAVKEWTQPDGSYCAKWVKDRDMPANTIKYSISSMGQWYSFKIKTGRYIIEFRDSLKLLPFKLEQIGESFKTEHRKLSIEYKGLRYAGCVITPEEEDYIRNDVLVLKEALEIMFNEGHDKLTIGSCCLAEYKKTLARNDYSVFFPNIYDIEIDDTRYGKPNAGEYVRRSYRGGWCYVVEGKEKRVKKNGITVDVNSLYPSMMHSSSGNRFPVGRPTFWKGNFIPPEATSNNRFFFIRFSTRFHIKEGKLPFVQIKNTLRYQGNKCLTTSDIYHNGKYYSSYLDYDGHENPCTVTLTMTMPDYELFLEHYYVEDFEILDGCYFETEIGIFDVYINHYKAIKQTSKGAIRELAKLFLNNLYGKMASNTDSSFKLAYQKDDNTIGFITIEENDKKPGYIPVGSAITSYARCFTIRAAQLNYHGPDNSGFIYADTDSLHLDITESELRGVTIHDTDFSCWKVECEWDEAIFTRQKTYIEHVISEGKPHYSVKCAGMPDRCKSLFAKALELTPSDIEEIIGKENKDSSDLFLLEGRKTLEDFDIGLLVPGKLLPKRILGGTVLVETTFEMR